METETTAQHTPGPWEAFENDTEGIHLVTEPHGVIVCEWIHTEADARLLAAVPEMLAFIETVYGLRLRGGIDIRDVNTGHNASLVDMARVLLARIEGR